MSETVLVAGASGYAGRYIVAELAAAGYRVRAVVRSRSRAEESGPHGAPSLAGVVAEWVEGDITEAATADGLCAGVDRVVSALGVTRQRSDPWDVDFLANRRLLADAERHDVRSFLYVGVMHVWSGTSTILRAKAAFTATLEHSPVPHQLVNPSGYFSDMEGFLAMARAGVVLLPPDPEVRVAPIHGADLAAFCVEKLREDVGSWDVGGPDVLTYPEIAALAFEAAADRPRMLTIPRCGLRAAVWLASRLGQRPRDLATFFAHGLTQTAVGECYGQRHLGDHFRDLCGGSSGKARLREPE